MTKFIDRPDQAVEDMLEGLRLVMAEYVDVVGHMVVRRGLRAEEPKVTSVTLGGAGHEPSSFGFSGRGWECVKVVGDIFAAPSAVSVAEAIRYADLGKGVLLYAGNHAGDVMSAKLAIKLLKRENIQVELVLLTDDISSFGREQIGERRGMAGSLALGKVIGAACEAGYPLQEVKRVAQRCNQQTATLAVATRGATHPVNGQVISQISPGRMVIGMGQHGEGSGAEETLQSARETIRTMGDRLAADLALSAGDRVSVTLNGAGSTTYLELLILYRDVTAYLAERGVTVAEKIVGEFLTTQEQGGFQLSFLKLDAELEQLMKAPCRTAFRTQP